jgi:hypothetical protein
VDDALMDDWPNASFWQRFALAHTRDPLNGERKTVDLVVR